MKRRTPIQIVAASALTLAFGALPALGQETVVEERYKSESYRSGVPAAPAPPPVQERTVEQHRTETTIEQRAVPPPPPPPATVEKRTYEEKVVTD
jgi:hypothetical protein